VSVRIAEPRDPAGIRNFVTHAPASQLRVLVDRLAELADRRIATRPISAGAAERALQLRDNLRTHVRVRVASLDAPLVVLILGPTGAGKSTLFNTLAERPASRTGVLRPTTRDSILLLHPDDQAALLNGPMSALDHARLRLVEDESIARGVVLIDAPDVDSIEHENRRAADRLVEAADLCIFVTTATRYADRVPWDVLARVRQRGLPLIVIVNRMPPGDADRADVLADVSRLFRERRLGEVLAAAPSDRDGPDGRDQSFIAVAEGDIVPDAQALNPRSVARIAAGIEELRSDRDARRELAARALAGSIKGLEPLLGAIAEDCDNEKIDVETLLRSAELEYEKELVNLRTELGRAAFLREEALRRWQEFVGADQITRYFAQGIGRVRGAVGSILRPVHAPVAEIRSATTDDIVAIGRLHAAEAARRTAADWADHPAVADAIAADPSLWATSVDFDDRFRRRLNAWIDGIAEEVRSTARPKQFLARGASIGVNAVGTGVMLATFMHTGGLTGTEVGIAAVTAFLNQKLLSALFGEAAMTELIAHARRSLDQALAASLSDERERFMGLLPSPDVMMQLAADLRAAATDLTELPVGSHGPIPHPQAIPLPAPQAARPADEPAATRPR
jgi:energy-coupling factor transporter ATP-binding protein EcfA2